MELGYKMDPLTAGAITGGASLIGTHLSNQANSAEAAKNRDFQEKMSNTAHQRQVTDLRKAGLNPILSALGSGASTPSGGQATMNDFAPGISKGAETAIAVRQQNKALQGMDATIGNTEADTLNKKETAKLIGFQTAESAQAVKQKELQNKVLQQTLPSMIKKAKAEGDYSELNQIMGIINSGANSAESLLGIGNIYKLLKKGKTKP